MRAREMTVAERLDEVFDLSNRQMGMMLAGAMNGRDALRFKAAELRLGAFRGPA